MSRQQKVHEKNNPTHDLELAAVVFARRFGDTIYALSRKHTVIAHLSVQRPLQEEIKRFELAVYARGNAPNLATLTVQSTLRDRIRAEQTSDELLQKWIQRDEAKGQRLYIVVDDIVKYMDRLWVPDSDSLRVKAENKRPVGKLRPLHIPEWRWENITMDFLTGLPRTTDGYNAIWVMVYRLTKSAHFLPIKKIFTMTQRPRVFEGRTDEGCDENREKGQAQSEIHRAPWDTGESWDICIQSCIAVESGGSS
ncbi:uncharacterized protein [Primulina eburnea]|uniref:uncharacterized protein n=1 Tax=Primulina eburnea TaxID=1245227 RepID=UPI003C6CBB11